MSASPAVSYPFPATSPAKSAAEPKEVGSLFNEGLLKKQEVCSSLLFGEPSAHSAKKVGLMGAHSCSLD